MATITESSTFDATVYQLETTDQVLGGAGGTSNLQAQSLANRTRYLFNALTALQSALPQNARNTVLTGKTSSISGDYELLISASSNSLLRAQASAGDPLIFTFSNGYGVNGEVFKTIERMTNMDLTVTALSGSYLAAIVMEAGGAGLRLDYINTGRVYFTTVQPTPPAGGTAQAAWYNPATGKWKFCIAGSGAWADFYVLIVGEFTVTTGLVDDPSIVTYPYRQPYYDETIAAGLVITSASNKVPLGGWLLCDGTAVSRAEYNALFKKLGTTYGAGDGSTTFNLPDLRGEFIRGWDNSRGVDASRVFGSAQADELKSHRHIMKKYNRAVGTGAGFFAMDDNGTDGSKNTELTGGVETRPRNVAMNFYIKF